MGPEELARGEEVGGAALSPHLEQSQWHLEKAAEGWNHLVRRVT